MYEELALYINGEFRQGSDGAGEDVINPATEETLAFLPHASKSDLDCALESAGEDSRYGATPPPMSAARCRGKLES